eukprot:939036_1
MHPKVKKRSRKRIESDERRPDSSCLVIKKRKLIKNDYPVVPVHINIAYQSIYLMLYSNMRKCGHIKRHFCFDDGIKLIAEYAMWRRQRCQGIGPSPRCKHSKTYLSNTKCHIPTIEVMNIAAKIAMISLVSNAKARRHLIENEIDLRDVMVAK